jgi:uncharacterized protein (TIGR02246 family)
MKSVELTALVLVTICLLVVPLAWSQGGNIEEQIKTLQTQLVQAVQKGDTSIFEKYYARDCYIIHGDGKQTTKAEEIEDFKSGALKYESIDIRDQKIRIYGDTAVVNSLASVKATVKGKLVSGDLRAIFVWVKLKGSWKEVAFQTTPVAPASK